METPERAPIPIHTCPRCDKQREEGLFREWRKPTKQRTVNCLICRLLMLSKTKTDDGTSERLKDAFRQELAVWLDARMGENKLSDGEKGRVFLHLETCKYMKANLEAGVAASATPGSQNDEHDEIQTLWAPLKDKAFMKQAAEKLRAIEAELGPSRITIEGQDLVFDTAMPGSAATDSPNSVPIIPRDKDTLIRFTGAIHEQCIALKDIYRAYIAGQSDLDELVQRKPLYRELLDRLAGEHSSESSLR